MCTRLPMLTTLIFSDSMNLKQAVRFSLRCACIFGRLFLTLTLPSFSCLMLRLSRRTISAPSLRSCFKSLISNSGGSPSPGFAWPLMMLFAHLTMVSSWTFCQFWSTVRVMAGYNANKIKERSCRTGKDKQQRPALQCGWSLCRKKNTKGRSSYDGRGLLIRGTY